MSEYEKSQREWMNSMGNRIKELKIGAKESDSVTFQRAKYTKIKLNISTVENSRR